ncbi:MAG TPA: PH domain-containing protein [Armatimonadota bacterium]|nr:PH domain-containing protein [Armatimonadota bacterium]
MAEEPLLVVRPSGWCFCWHWVFCWLIVPLIIALWKRADLELRIYDDRVVLERGVLSKTMTELYIEDIRAVEIRESFWGRLVGLGSISIASAGDANSVLTARGIPHPRRIHDLIQEQRRKAKGAGAPADE